MTKKKPSRLIASSFFQRTCRLLPAVILGSMLLLCGPSEAKAEGYFKEMLQAFVRGGKNLAGAPLEIPLTIREHQDKEQTLLFSYYRGFTDGSLQALNRFASGGWDLFAAFIPGFQEGIPPEPETLF